MVRDLVRVICDQVLDFAIPRSRIAEAESEFLATRSTAKFARLTVEARRLFTDLAQSGEGGELLLFVLAERLLKLPQLLCKMSLKTNSRMHVHGADGLHAGVDDATGRLVLYWGESKIFADGITAIRECLGSLAPMLLDDANGGSASDRDLQLLQRHVDLDDAALEAALKAFLDVEGEHYNSVEFRGLCLVGFDCDAYPSAHCQSPTVVDLSTVVKRISELLPKWKAQIKHRIQEEKLDVFGLHFICVPFPSADDFRARLREELDLAPASPVAALEAVASGDDAVRAAAVSTATAKPARRKKSPEVS
ncbi:MAG TPA: DUF1837 domain-containing protein [Geomonas sp.]|nr:DUF1837 domain-containing protein [Geomonas sp.]